MSLDRIKISKLRNQVHAAIHMACLGQQIEDVIFVRDFLQAEVDQLTHMLELREAKEAEL